MRFLVDTTWIVEYLRGNQDIIQKLRSFREDGLAVSIVSLGELYKGIFRSNAPAEEETAVDNFLSATELLNIDREICQIFGREDARLRQLGMTMGDVDLFIAATALRHDLVLLTAGTDFQRVEGLAAIYPG